MSYYAKCPSCSHEWTPTNATPSWQCPKCNKISMYGLNHDPNMRNEWAAANVPKYAQFSNQFVFDTSVFRDSLASQIDWKEASTFSSNFVHHRLVIKSNNRVEFSVGTVTKLFPAIFVLVGVCIFCVVYIESKTNVIGLLLGVAFIATGIYVINDSSKSIVFDQQEGYFWRGSESTRETRNCSDLEQGIRLADIHAIQLITSIKTNENSTGYYYFYETNLVLKSGKRINVACSRITDTLRKDATTLSTFLKKPLWDAIDITMKLHDTFNPLVNINKK